MTKAKEEEEEKIQKPALLARKNDPGKAHIASLCMRRRNARFGDMQTGGQNFITAKQTYFQKAARLEKHFWAASDDGAEKN